MNTQDERKAFEALQNPIVFERFAYIEKENLYIMKNDFRNDLFTMTKCNELNFGWKMYQESAKRAEEKLEGCVVVQPQGLVLTCAELLEALEFGAPDLKIEQTEYSEEQMSTEISIVHRDTGHSGSGLYAYCTECAEEGSVKLGDVEAARGGNE